MLNSITVSQLNTYVKSLIENDPRLTLISVSGDISNFKNHFASGHLYFTLKDDVAAIKCATPPTIPVQFPNVAAVQTTPYCSNLTYGPYGPYGPWGNGGAWA